MRLLHFLSVIPLFLTSAAALPVEDDTPQEAPAGTSFNGKNVPPMLELKTADLASAIKDGYSLVEFFSPYCGHCKHFAPTWQTLYELYYTSNPLPSSSSGSRETHDDMNSFTRFYDFRFARVDCVANGDACSQHEIKSFPSIVLFKNGEQVKKNSGDRSLSFMSEWVEETLESIKPGTRPAKGPKLPAVKAQSVQPPGADGVASGAASSRSPVKSKIPNEAGKSVDLTAENFQRLVTVTHDAWFIKFHTPWCHHCQAMAPNWQAMSRQMQGKLNIGEVNCETEKRLCKDVQVAAYPTIMFMKGGERVEYDGLRGVGDLMSFANKAVASGEPVLDVNAEQFEELEKKNEVLFLYFYDHATTSEDLKALDRLRMSLIGHAKLLKTSDSELVQRYKISTWPRLLVSRDGKPTYYTALDPQHMRDYRKVLEWMKSVWLPIVPELSATNAKEIMSNKFVVLAILSRDRPDEFVVAKREIKNAALEWIDKQTQAFQLERQELRDAKQLRIEEAEDRNDQRALRAAKQIRISMDDVERREVGFAWVDGIFWERWVRTTFGISVRDGEKVVIHDEDNRRYWDVTMTGNPIVPSRTSILETLARVVANPPKITAKSTTSTLGHFWWVISGGFLRHPLLSAGILLGVLIVMGIVTRRNLKTGSGGFFRVGEGKGGPMDGLLGNNGPTTEKAD
ncbi:protein disulfide isomerase [Polychaeton citri CBS 116435]|uniref:Protein disulfide isomerase n=1 Tax=Polychaeton citri CBS 116435 TaxID=1314669 RepID=A0A9P4Q091_9PEZI|nr:protein disulfide isomerase [Polychaeton citri CBS 116435]